MLYVLKLKFANLHKYEITCQQDISHEIVFDTQISDIDMSAMPVNVNAHKVKHYRLCCVETVYQERYDYYFL